MRSRSLWLSLLAGFGLNLPFVLTTAPGEAVPTVPAPPPSPGAPRVSQSSLEQLNSMFSPEIQSTMAACWEQGKVDLTANTPQDWVACGDGSVVQGVTRSAYVTTVADVMTASTLIGVRTAMETDPRVTPHVLSVFVTTPDGSAFLENIVQYAITQSGIQALDKPASSAILTDAVVSRLIANLQNPTRLDTLLGTPAQYTQTVNQFCTAPGMAVDEAQQQIGLDSIQLFAVCLDESGAARELLQQMQP